MSYATDEELAKYPLLHFSFENLDEDARAMYTLACQGSELGIREQLDAIWKSGATFGSQVNAEAEAEAFGDGWNRGYEAAQNEGK